MSHNIAFQIYGTFQKLVVAGREQTNFKTHPPEIPVFSERELTQLFQMTFDTMKESPPLIYVPAPCHVVGDLAGNIFDLIRILCRADSLTTWGCIFLGHYIAPNLYSLETLIFLFSLFCLFPRSVILLRGSTEFEFAALENRLLEEIMATYKSDNLFKKIIEIFNYLPLVAIVQEQYICVHGAITQAIPNLQVIQDIPKPINDVNVSTNQIIHDLIFETPDPDYVLPFLRSQRMRKLVNGSQIDRKGVLTSAGGKIISIFSHSNYQGNNNKSGFISIGADLEARGYAICPSIFNVRSQGQFQISEVFKTLTPSKHKPVVFRTILRKNHLSTKIKKTSLQVPVGREGSLPMVHSLQTDQLFRLQQHLEE